MRYGHWATGREMDHRSLVKRQVPARFYQRSQSAVGGASPVDGPPHHQPEWICPASVPLRAPERRSAFRRRVG